MLLSQLDLPCGRTMIATQITAGAAVCTGVDLQNPTQRASLEQPVTALEPLPGLIVIGAVLKWVAGRCGSLFFWRGSMFATAPTHRAAATNPL